MIVEAVAKEKGISSDLIFEFFAEGIEVSMKKQFPEGAKLQVEILPEENTIKGWRLFKLVDSIENVEAEMLFNEVEDEVVSDGYVWEPIEVNLTRQQFSIAKQVALTKIRNESRDGHIQSLLEKPYQYHTGTVKIIRKESLIVDISNIDIVIPKRNLLPRETFKIGEKIVFSIEKDEAKNNYVGTRTSPEFLKELFRKEVVQIEEGNIEIVACVRNPGFRSKVVVRSKSSKFDAVRMCIGTKGVHVKNIQSFLGTEIVEVIGYESDPAQMLVKCLSPLNINKIVIDEEDKLIELSVDDDVMAKAIGKGGQNIEMISKIIGWKINIYSQTDWDRKERFKSIAYVNTFKSLLDCDEELAQYLVDEGYTSVEDIAYTPADEMELTDLDEETILALKENAVNSLADEAHVKRVKEREELYLLGFSDSDIIHLHGNKIANTVDVADLATDELVEILPNIDIEFAKSIIMEARKTSKV